MSDYSTSVWLPYPSGVQAKCGQGSMSEWTHRGVYAWDFILPLKTPVISVHRGRVIYLVDHNTATGSNDYLLSNMIFVDHGGNRFASYLHHEANTALVKLGEIVDVGSKLAEVGSSGTVCPHIHFDIRGGEWNKSHPVLFKTANEVVKVEAENIYQSATPEIPTEKKDEFLDSMLTGDEFLGNGIQINPGLPAYQLSADSEVVYKGQAVTSAKYVVFNLWEIGKPRFLLSKYSKIDDSGQFSVRINVPKHLSGNYWYRLSIKNSSGSVMLPVWIKSKSE